MAYKDKYDHQQLNISFELLLLIQWLIENEQAEIKKLVGRALNQGLKSQIRALSTHQKRQQTAEILQGSIIDFFGFLEHLLHESSQEDDSGAKLLQQNLLPILNQLDSRDYSTPALQSSIEKVEAKYRSTSPVMRKEILCKELLSAGSLTKSK